MPKIKNKLVFHCNSCGKTDEHLHRCCAGCGSLDITAERVKP